MQNAGQQYGQGGASSHQNTVFGHSEPTTTSASGSITSSLRQFRRKPEEKHASQESHNTSESHVARVAPHSHFPANRVSDCYTRYQVQYPDYSTPTQVKYSEISEPNQPLQDHLSPSVIQKPKTKDYMEMCNLQQPHMKQAYPDHLGGQQPYTDPNVLSQAQYMPKESQVHSLYKPESQYYPKEPQYPNQLPHQMQKFNMPAQVRKFPENEFLSKLQRIHPSMARSIMSDHHLQESQRTYQNMDQSRMYPHHNQRYINHSTSVQNNLYPHSYMPPQHYPNYPPSCSYTRNPQMAPRFQHINPHDRSISPRRSFSDGVTMPINYGGMPQKISPNYPQYNSPDYAQHYQQRRSSVTQDYYQPHCRPTQYLPPQMPSQDIPESRVTVSDSIKQYIENWADEETATEMNQIDNNRLCKENVRTRDDQSTETVYTINASDVQYLEPLVAAESGIPVVASENGQYIIKSGLVDNSSGMIRIIDKNNPMDFGELSGERVVNLHIMDTIKPDCMLASKPNELNQRQATENLYNVNDKSRVVIHQNTVIQSSFQNSSNTKEPVQAPNMLDHSKLGSSLPVISDEQTSLEEELTRTIIRECKRETADKNCSPINLDQLEDLGDAPEQPSVIYPIKATSFALDKSTEVDASGTNIKNMPILEPHENIAVKQEKRVGDEDKTDQKDDNDFEENQNEDVEEKLDNMEEKEPNNKQLNIFAENSSEIKENPNKLEKHTENIENSDLIEETLNAISEKTGDFEETTYDIQEEIDKIAEETDTLNKIEEKLNEIEKIDVQELNKNQSEDLDTASLLSSAEVNKDEIILNNIVKDDTSPKFYSEEHINEHDILKSELFSLTEKMEQVIENKTNLTDASTDIQTSSRMSPSDSNSKDLFCSSNLFCNNLEVKENTISSDDELKNQQNFSSEQETSDLRNVPNNLEFKIDKDVVNKEYCDIRSNLPNIQESSEDTNSNATVPQKTLDPDLTELHRPYEESIVTSKSKRSKRIFSVDDIINNIGNNSKKFKRKEERRHSLKSTKEFLNHEIERASLLMQEISATKFKHNESKDENFKICALNKEKESSENPKELITEANEDETPSVTPNISQKDVSCEEKFDVHSGPFDIQKEIFIDDSSVINSNLTVIGSEEEKEEMKLLPEQSTEEAHKASVTQEFPSTIIAEEIAIEEIKETTELDNETERDITLIPENVDFGESNTKHLVHPDIKNVAFAEDCKSLENNNDNRKNEEKSEIVEFNTGKNDSEINKVENLEFEPKLKNETETEKVEEKIEILPLLNKGKDKDHTDIIYKSDMKTEAKVNSDHQLKQAIDEQKNQSVQETDDGGMFNPNEENNSNGTTEDQKELYDNKKEKLPENNKEKLSIDHKKQKKELEIKLEKLHKDDSKESVVKAQKQLSEDREEHNPKLHECGQESLECTQESSKGNVDLLDCDQLLRNQESHANVETSEDSEKSFENKGETFENKQELIDNKNESVEYLQESEVEGSQHHEIHYRNVIRVEESSVLLHIAGELVEINVNTVNGKRVITVVPLSSSAVVDLNDNYETLDSNEDTDPLKIDGEEKNTETLEFENLVSQPTFIEPTSEIIIGMDLSLEEEIQLDLEQPQQVISTKAAKKAYESDLQIPSITTSEDVYDHTKINSYSFNDKVSSSHEQCTSKKRKNVEERKSSTKNNKTKGKGFKKREIKNVKSMQEVIVNDEDDEFVPFKELIKARKLKKMRQQEIKKSTEIKADSTNKVDEIVKENNNFVDTKKQDAKYKPSAEKKKEVKKTKTPSTKTSIIKENRQKVKDLKPEKPKLLQIISGDTIKKAAKYSASEVTKKVTFREKVTENSETSENKKPYPDQTAGKNEVGGGTVNIKMSSDTMDGKKKLSLEEYNSRKRKLIDKCETEPSSKKIVTDIKLMPEHALESTSATSTGHINKLRMHRPKSLDDVHLLKSRDNSFTKRKLSAESCIAQPKSYDWEETQSPKCVTKDKRFNEFSGLISGNKETESNSVQPKADNPDVILQNYKEQVESKLSSLNIQIPRAVKPVTNTLSQLINPFSKTETTSLMQRFLRNDRLTSEEMQKIRKIISYKRLMQQLRTISSPIVSNSSLDLKYEVKRELGERDMKLHLKKLPVKKKRQRFRNLYSESTTESESDCGEDKTSGDYSVVQSNCLAGVVPKLIIKRKPEMPLPFVKLERLDMGMLINKKRRYIE